MKVGQVVIGGFIYNVNVDFKEADGITSKDCKLSDEDKKDLTAKVNAFAQEYMSALRNSTPRGEPLSKYELIQINEDGATYGGKSFRWDQEADGAHQGIGAPAFKHAKKAWEEVFGKLKELSTRSEVSNASTAIHLRVTNPSTALTGSIDVTAAAIAKDITTTTANFDTLPAGELYKLVLEETNKKYRTTGADVYSPIDWQSLSNLRAAVLNKLAEGQSDRFKKNLRTAVRYWIHNCTNGSQPRWVRPHYSYEIVRDAFNTHAQTIFDVSNVLPDTLDKFNSSISMA